MDDITSKLQLTGMILSVVGGVFGGIVVIIRMLKSYISNPFEEALKQLNKTIQDLRDDLNESRVERKENDKKLYDISDVHTKEISAIKGRVQTLEVVNHIGKGEKYD